MESFCCSLVAFRYLNDALDARKQDNVATKMKIICSLYRRFSTLQCYWQTQRSTYNRVLRAAAGIRFYPLPTKKPVEIPTESHTHTYANPMGIPIP